MEPLNSQVNEEVAIMPVDHHVALEISAHRQAIVLINMGEDADEAMGAVVNTMSSLLNQLSVDY